MNKLLYILFALLTLCGFCACSESTDAEEEFPNWQASNEAYMKDTLAFANKQIAQAKSQWGDAWEEHCDWRVYRSYCNPETSKSTWEDSIAVHVIERGTGSGSPMYTDSVRVTYFGRILPSTSYPEGYVFDKTGVSNKLSDALDIRYETPSIFLTSNVIEGWTTALLHMHIGDYWRVFIPSNMAYGESGTTGIPAYSTLIFDMRLKAYYRKGTIAGTWY